MGYDKTLLNTAPCPRCGSRDVRYRVTYIFHRLCRKCGKAWNESGDEE